MMQGQTLCLKELALKCNSEAVKRIKMTQWVACVLHSMNVFTINFNGFCMTRPFNELVAINDPPVSCDL